MRAELLTALTSLLNATGIAVSAELPWTSGAEPLYLKNMKRLYLSPEQRVDEDLIPILNGNNVKRRQLIVRGYLAVDAKNQPAGIDNALSAIKAARDATVFGESYERFVEYTTEITGDVMIYTVEYKFRNIE
jgi:hypothetical protein